MTTPIHAPDVAVIPDAGTGRTAAAVCLAMLAALAVAMGVGRFAFTPLFPLMVRDGLLDARAGALLAGANYLGYLLGALAAGRVPLRSPALLALGLVGTVAITAAVGWTGSLPAWVLLRFLACVMSAWALVAVSAWGLGWLAALGRANLAGLAFTGVGLGIAGAGLFCLVAGERGVPAPAVAPHAPAPAHEPAPARVYDPSARTGGLVVCYTLFGFGYILPATYLPALWTSLAGVTIAALLVGGTFMIVTLVGMQEVRARAERQATRALGSMTAGFAFGQLVGPLVNAAIGHAGLHEGAALRLALGLSAAGLAGSSVYLWREARRALH